MNLARPLVVFDLETTGLDVQTARIIEIAMLRLEPSDRPILWGDVREWHSLVSPGFALPPEIVEITGITDAELQGAPTFADLAGEIAEFIHGADFAGHNAEGYDVPLLAAEMARAGRPIAGLEHRAILDTRTIFAQKEPHTLAKAVEFYLRRDHTGAHRALADAKATLAVLAEQVTRYDLNGTAEDIELELRAPFIDRGRKFKRNDAGEIVIGFGKHEGKPLAEVYRLHPDYIRWMKDKMEPAVVQFLKDYEVTL